MLGVSFPRGRTAEALGSGVATLGALVGASVLTAVGSGSGRFTVGTSGLEVLEHASRVAADTIAALITTARMTSLHGERPS